MPRRPDVPCQHPGCAKLVPYGKRYCEDHVRDSGLDRESATRRGYDRKWQHARSRYLSANPLCVNCYKDGRFVKATVVDHIKPHRGDPKLFWDENNWQALCKKCHDYKTWNVDSKPTY